MCFEQSNHPSRLDLTQCPWPRVQCRCFEQSNHPLRLYLTKCPWPGVECHCFEQSNHPSQLDLIQCNQCKSRSGVDKKNSNHCIDLIEGYNQTARYNRNLCSSPIISLAHQCNAGSMDRSLVSFTFWGEYFISHGSLSKTEEQAV